jgi:hypothetical protein
MSSGIRPLEREDLAEVARLYGAVMASRDAASDAEVAQFFARTLLEQPWADPELPSLVYVADGEIVGFLGSNVRRMRFDGDPIRVGCSAHLVSLPRARALGVGAMLLRSYLGGPQDLTITDGATETVRRIWEALGGRSVHACAFSFVEIFRPVQLAAHRALDRRALHRFEGVVQPASALVDGLVGRLAPRVFRREPETAATAEPLDPRLLLEHLPAVTAGLSLVPDYDERYLGWLFEQLEGLQRAGRLSRALIERGRLWAELVRVEGRVAGWYVAHLRERGLCRILQLAAAERDAGVVLEQCAHRSREEGAAGLYGRVEPRLLPALGARPCLLRFAPGRLLVHSRRAEIVDAVLRGDALLTRMDGEWW